MKTADLYRTVASIDKAIKGIHTSGQTLQLEMHKVACSVLRHFGEHKDLRVVLRLIDAMPEMARVNGLKTWFEKYTAIAFNADGTAVVVKDKATKLGDAMAEPFWKLKAKEGEAYKPLNVDTAIEGLIAKLRKDMAGAQAAGKDAPDHSGLINALTMAKTIKPNLSDKGAIGSVDPLTL